MTPSSSIAARSSMPRRAPSCSTTRRRSTAGLPSRGPSAELGPAQPARRQQRAQGGGDRHAEHVPGGHERQRHLVAMQRVGGGGDAAGERAGGAAGRAKSGG